MRFLLLFQQTPTIEGDATVAGASQLATFGLQATSIKKLLPAFQNLAVGTYGVNVSQEQMIQTGNLVGKVMQGQIGALSRVGVTFSKQQGEILKTGTESQKTATLIEVLNQNYGGLAEKMANTPEGKIIQLRNAWGSIKDTIGYSLLPAVTNFATFVVSKIPTIQNAVTNGINAVKPYFIWFYNSMMPVLGSVFKNVKTFAVTAFEAIKNKVNESKPAIDSVKNILSVLKNTITNSFSGSGVSAINVFANGIPPITNALSEVLNIASGVANFFISNWNVIAPIIAGVTGAMLAYKIAVLGCSVAENAMTIAMGIKKAITVSSGVIMSVYTAAHWALSAGYGVATAAQWALNAAMTANPIGVVVVAIGALIAIGVALYMNWDKIKVKALELWISMTQTFENIKLSVTQKIADIKTSIIQIWDNIKTSTVEKFNNIKNSITTTFDNVKTNITNTFENVKSIVSNAIDKIKDFFRFDWQLPKIKLPHFNITGKFSLTPPSIPTIGVEWYKNGGILNSPTVFGINGTSAMVGGESGAEAVLPLSLFWDKLRQFTAQKGQANTENMNYNTFYINVNADGKTTDEIVGDLVPRLKLALANL